ncbi:PilZ domain-containing protein [Rhodoplanes azumiensis]|uniref:PilZ domain-containing protein n=1 Tax=Rhodoplanes azumiensis TaxID=1897628 RepID=A0ABW5AI41_9BRAD
MTTDRRKAARSPSYLGGQLVFSDQRLSAECIVRDRSDTGALLFVADAGRLPDSFDLTITKTRTRFRARTRWRRADALGVELTAPAAPPRAAPDDPFEHDRVLRLKAENERLKRRLRQLEE